MRQKSNFGCLDGWVTVERRAVAGRVAVWCYKILSFTSPPEREDDILDREPYIAERSSNDTSEGLLLHSLKWDQYNGKECAKCDGLSVPRNK